MAETKKPELVFIPSAGAGHIFVTVELSKLLLQRNHDLSITILVMKLPSDTKPISQPPLPRTRFIELRPEQNSSSSSSSSSPSPTSGDKSNTKSTTPSFLFYFNYIASHKGHVAEILAGIKNSGEFHLAGVVIDMFCTSMIDVANEFGVPSYVFFTSGAAMLGVMLHLQSLRDDSGVDVTELQDSGSDLAIPTYKNPVGNRFIPSIVFDKSGGCDAFLNHAKLFRQAKGVILNTFQELEIHALKALLEDKTIPPVYSIGPILSLNSDTRENDSIMKWLDLQPESSVLFLCFGSMGAFDEEQNREIATALEQTGTRFVWSLRKPQPKGIFAPPGSYEDPGEILPEGFLARTAELGRVIGWAPQTAVLAHPAVGGFVTHCGWNSVLESVWNGVPMATWPLYAEQQVNALLLVNELGLGVEIKMDYRKEVMRKEGVVIVSAEVIGNGILKLMDSESEVRSKVKEMKQMSRLAVVEGGSSFTSLSSFLNNAVSHITN